MRYGGLEIFWGQSNPEVINMWNCRCVTQLCLVNCKNMRKNI